VWAVGEKKRRKKMSKQKVVKGYKVFNPDWTCRGFQYQVGKCYEIPEKPVVCKRGFHFCKKLVDCYEYYDFDENNKVAEITAYGEIVIENNKSCTNKIRIEREINWNEVLAIVNTGENCTGLGNIGNDNSGIYNNGNCNKGSYNDGSYNSGNGNSGNYNSGHHNDGYSNNGNYNEGNYNKGNYNKGNNNIGNDNNGCYNSGHHNNGNDNSGSYNNGCRNSGNYNNGNYNISDYSNGCFNTKQTKMFLFNQLSNWTLEDWYNSKASTILDVYVSVSPIEKTKEEIFEQQQQNWNQLSQEQKNIVMAIPNFDKEIFKEITGIDVDKGVMKHEKDC
jgi:hypothetical protein